jgi:hypothetical protein
LGKGNEKIYTILKRTQKAKQNWRVRTAAMWFFRFRSGIILSELNYLEGDSQHQLYIRDKSVMLDCILAKKLKIFEIVEIAEAKKTNGFPENRKFQNYHPFYGAKNLAISGFPNKVFI